jgi:quercetin dioxygenase-like cupin family protein
LPGDAHASAATFSTSNVKGAHGGFVPKHCVNWTELPEEVLDGGATRRVIQGELASFLMIHVPAGTSAPRNTHEYEQIIHVISGSGVVETEQGEKRFGPGMVLHFPPKTWHAASFDTDTVLLEANIGR